MVKIEESDERREKREVFMREDFEWFILKLANLEFTTELGHKWIVSFPFPSEMKIGIQLLLTITIEIRDSHSDSRV